MDSKDVVLKAASIPIASCKLDFCNLNLAAQNWHNWSLEHGPGNLYRISGPCTIDRDKDLLPTETLNENAHQPRAEKHDQRHPCMNSTPVYTGCVLRRIIKHTPDALLAIPLSQFSRHLPGTPTDCSSWQTARFAASSEELQSACCRNSAHILPGSPCRLGSDTKCGRACNKTVALASLLRTSSAHWICSTSHRGRCTDGDTRMTVPSTSRCWKHQQLHIY